ncbi:hypothetical protein HN51_068784, partial [Arachis hypogaea]
FKTHETHAPIVTLSIESISAGQANPNQTDPLSDLTQTQQGAKDQDSLLPPFSSFLHLLLEEFTTSPPCKMLHDAGSPCSLCFYDAVGPCPQLFSGVTMLLLLR